MARFRFSFWLDGKKDDELLVAEVIDDLKKQRNFSAVVRDGIMIVNELRLGKVDLLLKLYPWVADAIRPPMPVTLDEGDLRRQIDDLKQIVLQQGGVSVPSVEQATMKPSLGGMKKVSLSLMDDDDEDTIVLNKSTGTNIMDNFFASFAKLGS
jgi:hypothetical protein